MEDGTTSRLIFDVVVILLTTGGAMLLGHRFWRRRLEHQERGTRFLSNRRAVLTGTAVGLLAGAISVVSGAVLGGLVTAVLVAWLVAAVVDRVSPAVRSAGTGQ